MCLRFNVVLHEFTHVSSGNLVLKVIAIVMNSRKSSAGLSIQLIWIFKSRDPGSLGKFMLARNGILSRRDQVWQIITTCYFGCNVFVHCGRSYSVYNRYDDGIKQWINKFCNHPLQTAEPFNDKLLLTLWRKTLHNLYHSVVHKKAIFISKGKNFPNYCPVDAVKIRQR